MEIPIELPAYLEMLLPLPHPERYKYILPGCTETICTAKRTTVCLSLYVPCSSVFSIFPGSPRRPHVQTSFAVVFTHKRTRLLLHGISVLYLGPDVLPRSLLRHSASRPRNQSVWAQPEHLICCLASEASVDGRGDAGESRPR